MKRRQPHMRDSGSRHDIPLQEENVRSLLRLAMRSARRAAFGVCVVMGTASVAVACSADDADPGAGGAGGSGGTGAGTGGTGGSSVGGSTDGSTDCSLRAEVDTYSANMTKRGKNNIMSFLLIQSDPAPPIKGNNVFKLKVTGSDGMPVSKGLALRVWMPEHRHDSPSLPMVTYDAASGSYTLNPIDLSIMPGVWRISPTINDESDPPIPIDTADFNFCIN
ncbi:MAG TPA: hypothetical protein VK550_30095 [Polyangiaceae bacterium]|nr:hypothetical protein [Polyangiaceae bacterium]